MTLSPKSILITGAAGYIGAMLADQFSRLPEVVTVVAVDMLPCPEFLKGNKKIVWLQGEITQSDWAAIAKMHQPETIIHCAWQIKELYGKRGLQRRLNIEASRKVFQFALGEPYVRKLIHFSTISSYGASAENILERRFVEDDPLKENEYLYGMEKKEAEEILRKMYDESDKSRQIFVVRPTSVTGPRGRYGAGKKGLLHMLQNVLPVVPRGGKSWCRQYVHEDDLTDLVGLLTFTEINGGRGYDVLNAAPEDIVLASDMAQVFEKKILPVNKFFVRAAFAAAWHFTRGRIPTGRGGWKFFCYPLVVSGVKVAQKYGFRYKFSSLDALSQDGGRYAGR